MKKTLVSGVKPTGTLHLGNYFGAIKQLVDLQSEYNPYVFIADLHAITTVQNGRELHEHNVNTAIDYLALGIDPKKATLFRQSHVPAHTELAWIFNCITTMPYLMRAHAFKDAEAKNKEINVGIFDYPMLMAADILLYQADIVPVGNDQKQHIEYARDTAEKFNRIFGETFTIPEPYILDTVGVVPGTDGRKMSKSYGNVIGIFATREEIQKAVMGIVTDSGSDIPENVYKIHRLFKTEDELAPLYAENKGKYKNLKEALIEEIDAFISPLREKRKEVMADMTYVNVVLKDGADNAQEVSQKTMEMVRKNVGLA